MSISQKQQEWDLKEPKHQKRIDDTWIAEGKKYCDLNSTLNVKQTTQALKDHQTPNKYCN